MDLLILSNRQKDELHKALIQYLSPLLEDHTDTLENLRQVLNTSGENDIIPNYLEKKWSTVLRLQKRIMDLENELSNLKSIVDSQPSEFVSSDKINWLPNAVKEVFKTQTNQQITCIAIHPFSPVTVCGCSDGSIIVWNLATDSSIPEKIIKAHTRSVSNIVWSKTPIDITGTPEYVFASSSSDLSVKIWHGSSYKQLRNFNGHEHTVSSVVFSKNSPNILYSVSRDKTVKAWDLVNAISIKTFIGHSDWVRNVDVINEESSNGDFILTCSNDQSIRLSHADSGTGLSLLIGHGHVVEDCKFLPLISNAYIDKFLEKSASRFASIPSRLIDDQTYINLGFKYCVSAGRDNTVRLWLLPPPVLQPHRAPLPSNMNNSQGWLIDTFTGHTSWVKALAVHPNGRFIFSCSDDKTIKIWDLDTLFEDGKVKCIRTLKAHDGFVNAVDFAGFETEGAPKFGDEKLLEWIQQKMRCVFISGGVDCSVRVWR